LSGGQAQRVALARALVNRPKVLLFDEPLSALDLQIRRELQVELKEIHRELGRTFIYVTHDQEEAMSMSDRVVVMKDGRIIQAGTPIELYRSPKSMFVASFVGSSNIWKVRILGPGDGGTIVDVAGRQMLTRQVRDIRAGEAAWLVLRAEVLDLAPARGAEPETNTCWRGKLADVRFVGPVVHYRVYLGPDRIVSVSRPSQQEQVLVEGQEVIVSWQPKDAIVLPGENEDQLQSTVNATSVYGELSP
jgi:ABC-type Fe3+/spermidine/putrescine transport system ATPase subunit